MANGLGGTIHDLFVRLSGLGLVLSAYLLIIRAGYFCIMLIQIETPSFQSFAFAVGYTAGLIFITIMATTYASPAGFRS